MDGKNQEILLESSNNLTISMVQSMVVDPQTSTLYWADSSADHIGRLQISFCVWLMFIGYGLVSYDMLFELINFDVECFYNLANLEILMTINYGFSSDHLMRSLYSSVNTKLIIPTAALQLNGGTPERIHSLPSAYISSISVFQGHLYMSERYCLPGTTVCWILKY